MVVGILQVELRIDWAHSLKDKRSVVASLKDRLHREHQVSVAEIATQDNPQVATIGIAIAGSDATYVRSMIDRILDRLREHRDAVLSDFASEIITGGPVD